MGIAFDLATVNWLAHLLQPGGHIPRRPAFDERDSLEMFLSQLPERFFSSRGNEDKVRRIAEAARAQLSRIPPGQEIPLELLESLQKLLSSHPWIGMIVPSMKNVELDRFLASPGFLRDLVYEENWPDDGLIMQPRDLGDHPQALLDVFPPFQTALNAMTRWPGLLFWRPNKDSVFLPFARKTEAAVRECAGWALSNLKISRFHGLKAFEAEYFRRFPEARATAASITTLLHISDLHIGSTAAATSLPRLQQLLRDQIREIPNGQKVVLVISGDLIDDPKDEYYNSARQFLDAARDLTEEPPILVLGNHDVRTDGYLSENLRNAIKLPTDRVRWFDDQRLGLVCFNSVVGGRLAAGKIGPEQFADVGNEIDRKRDWRDHTLVGVLHHHPLPVDNPAWYAMPFYERIFGRFFEKTDQLEDAADFGDFVRQRRFAAVLHGHKHIPRVASIQGPPPIAVLGCGSSVGKVPTNDGRIFLSLNRIDINHQTGSLSCRLMAERTLGAGVSQWDQWESHEILHAQAL